MLLDAPKRYGQHYNHARSAAMYLTRCIKSVERDRVEMFGRLFSLMKKHHTLCFFSVLRLHKVQGMMDLRQVLESGAAAAFAIAFPEAQHFVDVDALGFLDPKQTLTKKRYDWLAKNYPDASEWIATTKRIINGHAHANVISGDSTFRIADDNDAFASTPFFDVEDEYFVKGDLWLASSVAIKVMDLFYDVATDVARAGRSVIEFRDDFQTVIQGLASESNNLLAGIQATKRFRAAKQRAEQRHGRSDPTGTI